jgi:hypothetical protein
MIVDFIWSGVYTILNAVFSALPTVSVTFTSVYSQIYDVAKMLSPWDVFFPLSEIASILVIIVGTMLPAFLVYKTANWIWRHIPDLGGFGPGAG